MLIYINFARVTTNIGHIQASSTRARLLVKFMVA